MEQEALNRMKIILANNNNAISGLVIKTKEKEYDCIIKEVNFSDPPEILLSPKFGRRDEDFSFYLDYSNLLSLKLYDHSKNELFFWEKKQ